MNSIEFKAVPSHINPLHKKIKTVNLSVIVSLYLKELRNCLLYVIRA